MNIGGTYPKLTKEYILERITQEEIMFYYLKIPVNETTCVGSSFRNPFREDNNPTCNFYYDTSGKLRLRDFAGDLLDRLYNMDVFDVVGRVNNINPNDKQGFKLVQNIIAKDFKIHKYKGNDDEIRKLEDFLVHQKDKKKKIKQIKVVPRAWNRGDEEYWYKKYGISSNTLKRYKVYPVQELYIENNDGYLNHIYSYKYSNPAFAFYGEKEQELHLWKIYFPFHKGTRYNKIISNKQFVHGFEQFLPTRIGVITKSLKDVMLLQEYGIQAVAVSSESTLLAADQMFMLKQYCDIVVSLFDYDAAGIKMANKAKKLYNIQPLMLTRGKYGQPDYGVKDISDFREAYGYNKTKLLINEALNYLSNRIEDANKTRQNCLWIF